MSIAIELFYFQTQEFNRTYCNIFPKKGVQLMYNDELQIKSDSPFL